VLETATLETLLEAWLESLSMTRLDPGSLVLAVFGVMCCFFGYRTIRLLLDVSGFAVLGLTSAVLAGYFAEGNLVIVGLALLAGGITGGIIAHLAYRVGVTLFGGGMSALLAWNWAQLVVEQSNYALALVLIAGLSGAAAAFFLERFAVTLISAAVGAWFTMRGILLLLEAMEITPARPDTGTALQSLSTEVLSWMALLIAGFVFQLVAGSRKKKSGQ